MIKHPLYTRIIWAQTREALQIGYSREVKI